MARIASTDINGNTTYEEITPQSHPDHPLFQQVAVELSADKLRIEPDGVDVAQISGQVLDYGGQPLAGARPCSLQIEGEAFPYTFNSDAQGAFSFPLSAMVAGEIVLIPLEPGGEALVIQAGQPIPVQDPREDPAAVVFQGENA